LCIKYTSENFFFLLPLAPTWRLAPILEHRADFSVFLIIHRRQDSLDCDQTVARPLPKHRTTQTQKNAHTHETSMPWVGFELTIPASERAKTVHASDRSATVTGTSENRQRYIIELKRLRCIGGDRNRSVPRSLGITQLRGEKYYEYQSGTILSPR
jgi:hypothetical protein